MQCDWMRVVEKISILVPQNRDCGAADDESDRLSRAVEENLKIFGQSSVSRLDILLLSAPRAGQSTLARARVLAVCRANIFFAG